ncbi:MAG: hypothetical protein NZ483_08080 [Verrucomicrobiae bacterium]|nr:hypothetical protein [Verrucomicrobiae bacterium]MDW8344877.1 hypothetical protein [Verrucomicrobiae bacterium]
MSGKHMVQIWMIVMAVTSAAWAQDIVYSLHFNDGLPNNWIAGQLTSEGLPEGSKQAVTARVTDGKAERIASHKEWVKGLFSISEDLYFNYRIRMTRPEWYLLFLQVKPAGPTGQSSNYIARPTPGPANEWHVVSVPVKEFQQTGKDISNGPPPPVGEVCTSFFFDTQGRDLGITIDRIWVSKGKPVSTPPNP